MSPSLSLFGARKRVGALRKQLLLSLMSLSLAEALPQLKGVQVGQWQLCWCHLPSQGPVREMKMEQKCPKEQVEGDFGEGSSRACGQCPGSRHHRRATLL